VSAAGYQYSTVNENVAQGQQDEEDVMNSWVQSSGHYRNIMDPNVVDMGGARRGEFWTQVFAKPMSGGSAGRDPDCGASGGKGAEIRNQVTFPTSAVPGIDPNETRISDNNGGNTGPGVALPGIKDVLYFPVSFQSRLVDWKALLKLSLSIQNKRNSTHPG
jgi:hypothetical protein